jgi:GNAT superfamily N-acetyltransferase
VNPSPHVPTPTLSFSPALPIDAPALASLAASIWHRVYPEIIPTAQIDYMLGRMYAEPVILSEMQQGTIWEWARANSLPVGFLSHSPSPDRSRLLLHKLYLDPDWHGRGLGQQMLQHILDHARQAGFQTVELRVNRNNRPALRAYYRAGFIVERPHCADIGSGFLMDDFILVHPDLQSTKRLTRK